MSNTSSPEVDQARSVDHLGNSPKDLDTGDSTCTPELSSAQSSIPHTPADEHPIDCVFTQSFDQQSNSEHILTLDLRDAESNPAPAGGQVLVTETEVADTEPIQTELEEPEHGEIEIIEGVPLIFDVGEPQTATSDQGGQIEPHEVNDGSPGGVEELTTILEEVEPPHADHGSSDDSTGGAMLRVVKAERIESEPAPQESTACPSHPVTATEMTRSGAAPDDSTAGPSRRCAKLETIESEAAADDSNAGPSHAIPQAESSQSNSKSRERPMRPLHHDLEALGMQDTIPSSTPGFPFPRMTPTLPTPAGSSAKSSKGKAPERNNPRNLMKMAAKRRSSPASADADLPLPKRPRHTFSYPRRLRRNRTNFPDSHSAIVEEGQELVLIDREEAAADALPAAAVAREDRHCRVLQRLGDAVQYGKERKIARAQRRADAKAANHVPNDGVFQNISGVEDPADAQGGGNSSGFHDEDHHWGCWETLKKLRCRERLRKLKTSVGVNMIVLFGAILCLLDCLGTAPFAGI